MAAREMWRELRAQEEAERIEREKPLRTAERQLQQSAQKFGRFIRDAALNDPLEIYEPGVFDGIPRWDGRPPNLKAALDAALPWAQNEPRYVGLRPEHRAEVAESILAFLIRNSLRVTSPAAWKRGFEILLQVGAVPVAPNPKPEPMPEPEPVIQTVAEPNEYDGWDIATGEPKKYSRREVETMSGDTYRRAFRLCGDRTPRFVYPRR